LLFQIKDSKSQVKNLAFKTNDIIRKKLETAYKEDAPWPVFTPNTKIYVDDVINKRFLG